MKQEIALMALVVKDYDEAIEVYVNKLNFQLIEDTRLSPTKRWIRVSPKGSTGPALLLARAVTPEQVSRVGNQTGGRVFLFLHTDDIARDKENLDKNGISIVRKLREEPYGKVLVFSDLYGNLWDLIEPPG
jgi:predicted enzyme related to lactoylglutathione lyase